MRVFVKVRASPGSLLHFRQYWIHLASEYYVNRARYMIAASVQHCRRTSIAGVVRDMDDGTAIDHMITTQSK